MVSDSSTVSNNMVSIDVGNLNLTKGTDYDVSVTATNSIGTSEPVTGTLSVPSECVDTVVVIVSVCGCLEQHILDQSPHRSSQLNSTSF